MRKMLHTGDKLKDFKILKRRRLSLKSLGVTLIHLVFESLATGANIVAIAAYCPNTWANKLTNTNHKGLHVW